MNEEWGNRKAEARARRFRMIALALKHQEMSIEYRTGGQMYKMDYQELKTGYNLTCQLSDEDFLQRLPVALHLACAICYLKGMGPDATIGDKGVIHEIVHLMHIPDQNITSVAWVRELFKSHCKLA